MSYLAELELDLAINSLVEVKAPCIRLGHRGRVFNRFARTRPLYAVQFPDNCVGFFDRSDLEKLPPGPLGGSPQGLQEG
ncbi:hypothetical protein LCGC14_0699300 [marine sediment metagenome]|uniref:Uncharacterized protein n=1 Tax=marine sediment metagenome TaxID=412755 RepID=A0A0F9TR37_9ZZZZ